jgi:hypothetical protein
LALCRRTETQSSTLVQLASVVRSLTDIAEQQNLNFNQLTLPNFRNGLTVFQIPPQRQAPIYTFKLSLHAYSNFIPLFSTLKISSCQKNILEEK